MIAVEAWAPPGVSTSAKSVRPNQVRPPGFSSTLFSFILKSNLFIIWSYSVGIIFWCALCMLISWCSCAVYSHWLKTIRRSIAYQGVYSGLPVIFFSCSCLCLVDFYSIYHRSKPKWRGWGLACIILHYSLLWGGSDSAMRSNSKN